MALVGKIFKEERDILYIRGEYRGLQKGIEKGKIEEQYEIARNFKKMGVAVADISKGTGLSIQEIEDL